MVLLVTLDIGSAISSEPTPKLVTCLSECLGMRRYLDIYLFGKFEGQSMEQLVGMYHHCKTQQYSWSMGPNVASKYHCELFQPFHPKKSSNQLRPTHIQTSPDSTFSIFKVSDDNRKPTAGVCVRVRL